MIGTGLTDANQSNQDEIEQQDFDVVDQNFVVDEDGIRINSVLQRRAGPDGGYQLEGSTNPNQRINIDNQDDQQGQDQNQNNNNKNNNINNNYNSGNGVARRTR